MEQNDVVLALIDQLEPELERVGMEKDGLFLQWAEMAGLEGDEAEAFRVMQQLEFNRLYNDGQLDVVESDFVIPALLCSACLVLSALSPECPRSFSRLHAPNLCF